MIHFGGKGDYELTLSYAISLWKSVPGWLEVIFNRQHFIPLPGNLGLQPLRHWPWAASAFWCPVPKTGVKVTWSWASKGPWWVPQQLLLQIIWSSKLFAAATAAALTMGRFAQSWRDSDVAFTPALGVGTSQVLGLCMAFWKPDSDYLLLLTISVFNAENIMCEIGILSEEMQRRNHEMSPHLFIILEENSKQNCFASSMLPSLLAYVGIKTWRKQTCLPHPQVYSLPSGHYLLQWQPPKHHTLRSIQSIHNKTSTKTQALH